MLLYFFSYNKEFIAFNKKDEIDLDKLMVYFNKKESLIRIRDTKSNWSHTFKWDKKCEEVEVYEVPEENDTIQTLVKTLKLPSVWEKVNQGK